MKVSINWLKELVNLKISESELVKLFNLRTIGTKAVTSDFIELDMKGYNRADLLSLRGVAHEVAAITKSSVKFEESEPQFGQNFPQLEVKVENNNLVTVYCLVKIEGLRPEKSPKDWVKKLADSGVRSINLLVDITNLIMLEFGQPMHTFDGAYVADETVIVRSAQDGETVKTLDGKVRKLTNEDLVIADPKQIIGIAGVMGGENSEIKNQPTTILLEAAIFDPISIRKTAQRLNLPSEASKRFQHGLTSKRLYQALSYAIKMYQYLGGKVTALSIYDNSHQPQSKILLRVEKLNSLIGIEIKPEQVEEYLKRLNFKLTQVENGWEVTPPYYRLDISEEVDVIEEIARIYGYENIPSLPLKGEVPAPIDQKLFKLIKNLTDNLVNQGLDEILTYSFYSTNLLNNLKLEKYNLIKIQNPISSETEYLRDNLWSSLLEKVVENLKNFDNVKIFEIGKVYKPKLNELPEEEYKLAAAVSNSNPENIIELKQRLEAGLKSAGFEVKFEAQKPDSQLFHPNGYWQVLLDDKVIGFLAQIHPKISDKLGTSNRVSVLEINLKSLNS